MMNTHPVLLLAAMATAAQVAEMPEAWQRKVEAAARAEESHHPVQAEALLIEVVTEAEKFGRDDLRLAQPLELLAGFYMNRKHAHYAQAEPLLRRALVIRRTAQGPEHLDVAGTQVLLAMCLTVWKEKEAETAGPMLQRALMTFEKLKGKDDPTVASVLHRLACWNMYRKEYDTAVSALTRAVTIREKAFGPESIKVADFLDDLGDLHLGQIGGIDMEAKYAEIKGTPHRESKSEMHGKQAESFYKRALAIREKALKPDHPDIAETLYNLGQLAVARERPRDVEQYFARWLTLQEKANAPVSERLANALFFLGDAASERKNFVQAERRLARAQAVFGEVNGAESNDVSTIRTKRATVARNAGRFDDAEQFLKQGLAVQAAVLGADDPDLMRADVLMAGRYQDHADDRQGHALWHRLEILAKLTSQEHKHDQLGEILTSHAELLRRTNRVVPRPTEEDLAYLKNVGAVLPITKLDDLVKDDLLIESLLDDQGLAHIARLYCLERLNLGERITDAGLAHIKDLTNLCDLGVFRAQITNAGLANLVDLKNLLVLNLGFTRVGDTGLAHLKMLKNLRELNLMYTNITDVGLDHLKDLASLSKLNIKSTKVTQTGVDRLRRERPGLLVEYESGDGFVLPTQPATLPAEIPPLPTVPQPLIPRTP